MPGGSSAPTPKGQLLRPKQLQAQAEEPRGNQAKVDFFLQQEAWPGRGCADSPATQWSASQSLSGPGSRPCRPQVGAVLVSGSRQQLGRGCLGKDIRGWSLEEFHRQAELNFTEEDVHEVAAHLLCHLGDQVPFRTDQDPLRVG